MFYYYFLETCSYLMRDKKGKDPDGMEGETKLGGLETGEPVITIHCTKKSIFNKMGRLQIA